MEKVKLIEDGITTPDYKQFEKELRELINKFSLEAQSDTPDFVLSEYLMSCIANFNKAVEHREYFFGRKIR